MQNDTSGHRARACNGQLWGQEVKGQGRSHENWVRFGDIALGPLSRVDWGVQLALGMLPLKRGLGVAHSVNCPLLISFPLQPMSPVLKSSLGFWKLVSYEQRPEMPFDWVTSHSNMGSAPRGQPHCWVFVAKYCMITCRHFLPCAYVVWPYLEVHLHSKAYDQSMNKPFMSTLLCSIYFWSSSGWVHRQIILVQTIPSVYNPVWEEIFPNISTKYQFTNFLLCPDKPVALPSQMMHTRETF